LITLGSPLGLRAIRHLMPNSEYGAAEGVLDLLEVLELASHPPDPPVGADRGVERRVRVGTSTGVADFVLGSFPALK